MSDVMWYIRVGWDLGITLTDDTAALPWPGVPSLTHICSNAYLLNWKGNKYCKSLQQQRMYQGPALM